MNKSNCKSDVDKAQQDIDFAKNIYIVELTTNKGLIYLEFFPDLAPGHVKNFLALCKIGFYDGLTFHRVIEGFMIQGGCPLGTGTGDGGYKIKAEFNKTKHVPGILSMARSSDPNSAGTQFFICLEAYPSLDGQYTAFGRVLGSGVAKEKLHGWDEILDKVVNRDDPMETVNKIGLVKTDRGDKPVDKVVIEKATVKVKPLAA